MRPQFTCNDEHRISETSACLPDAGASASPLAHAGNPAASGGSQTSFRTRPAPTTPSGTACPSPPERTAGAHLETAGVIHSPTAPPAFKIYDDISGKCASPSGSWRPDKGRFAAFHGRVTHRQRRQNDVSGRGRLPSRKCQATSAPSDASASHEAADALAPVAQLDRAPDYESGGQRFESFRARQLLHENLERPMRRGANGDARSMG